jgi:hypothetical protein
MGSEFETCPGLREISDRAFHNWGGPENNRTSLVGALPRSRAAFFHGYCSDRLDNKPPYANDFCKGSQRSD